MTRTEWIVVIVYAIVGSAIGMYGLSPYKEVTVETVTPYFCDGFNDYLIYQIYTNDRITFFASDLKPGDTITINNFTKLVGWWTGMDDCRSINNDFVYQRCVFSGVCDDINIKHWHDLPEVKK